jgi:hypothetical protein
MREAPVPNHDSRPKRHRLLALLILIVGLLGLLAVPFAVANWSAIGPALRVYTVFNIAATLIHRIC